MCTIIGEASRQGGCNSDINISEHRTRAESRCFKANDVNSNDVDDDDEDTDDINDRNKHKNKCKHHDNNYSNHDYRAAD